ncbi:MAG: glutamate--tRNA ligase [Deltaproteobacteria bacterium]|nr:glutamate--tRNA ligase [Deltaproteobacteria bacterium]
MSNTNVVTRFPPSPTGYLHIGGARTALFNWLFARQRGGKFILRIEDTDEQRSTEEATTAILESMEWLGLDWDEGPYFQSRRYHIYNEVIDRLLEKGEAYHCHCSPETLDRQREEARKKGLKPKYNGTCRDLGLCPAQGSVVRLKTPHAGITQFNDLVKGPIRFNNEELDDLVIRRSNGSPTYHLAVVADDISLGMTHIIRGDDHVNNTPRQILIYKALEEPIPQYAHLPMILGPDRTRLSKRHGAMSVLAYREMGYLPHALLNGLARLGWSHGDQEKFSMEELIEKFSLDHVGKAAGVFNAEKLLDLNAWHIRESSDRFLAERLRPFLEKEGFQGLDIEKIAAVASILKVRSKTLVDMVEGARFCLSDDIDYEKKGDNKFLKQDVVDLFESLCGRIEVLSHFDRKGIETLFAEFLAAEQVPLKKLAQPLRVALTGRTASPGIFEVMEVLGKNKVIERIKKAVVHIKAKKEG